MFDVLINQYLLSLGEFAMDNFEGTHQLLIILLFILATFLTQVTVLNMLIAIMGNTFDSVKESETKSEVEMKVGILVDYICLIREHNTDEMKNFIVCITLDEEDDEKSEWEGSVNMIRSSIKKTKEEILGDVRKKNESIVELVQTLVAQEKKANILLSKNISQVSSTFDSKIKEMEKKT